ncbi:MAG: type II toxin-antitoxin system PemK/MazF family toxin [Planctomycetota bacterium]
MVRGEVWWADIPEPAGSGPGYRRPVLVVQADEFNASRLGTVVVAMFTSNMKCQDLPGCVAVGRREGGLPKESVLNLTQVFTVDRRSLTARAGRLSEARMSDVDAVLRTVLAV